MAESNYLLDTQVALWIMLADSRVSERVFRDRFLGNSARLIFHQASTWEVQIKFALGKLPLPRRPEHFLLESVAASGFSYERIEDEGIFFLDKLPEVHRDPFDRLLIAHAALNSWVIISADKTFERYPVRVELI